MTNILCDLKRKFWNVTNTIYIECYHVHFPTSNIQQFHDTVHIHTRIGHLFNTSVQHTFA